MNIGWGISYGCTRAKQDQEGDQMRPGWKWLFWLEEAMKQFGLYYFELCVSIHLYSSLPFSLQLKTT